MFKKKIYKNIYIQYSPQYSQYRSGLFVFLRTSANVCGRIQPTIRHTPSSDRD
jgi:hypothetical protein